MLTMIQKSKLAIGQLFVNPNARIIFILGTLVLAALSGGAPNDHGGS
jgi:hypothetical protein